MLLFGCRTCLRTCLPFDVNLCLQHVFRQLTLGGIRTMVTGRAQKHSTLHANRLGWCRTHCQKRTYTKKQQLEHQRCSLQAGAACTVCPIRHAVSEASISSSAPTFVVMRFDFEGNVTTFEKKKTELCQELSLQARDLRFQHNTSLTARNNCIIIRMEVSSIGHKTFH